ncbi:hypothetical protein [Campylobacter hyointestinalis]|uniref:hypothetical protein n=1 Tax=Campylobacter hyointestinalis TaxID=198 RepID=UPI000751002B|nr:hypothetical protein [Campylobacter hyointestinalis]PPB62662.1 hypothetical protein CDQ73_06715 [Campylobacter hyointestinalis subsp. hyointestinalis]
MEWSQCLKAIAALGANPLRYKAKTDIGALETKIKALGSSVTKTSTAMLGIGTAITTGLKGSLTFSRSINLTFSRCFISFCFKIKYIVARSYKFRHKICNTNVT